MQQQEGYILALDTATPACSVAITQGTRAKGKVLAAVSLASSVTHSHRLLSTILMMMKEVAIEKEMIGGIAVGLGPGSFTGLRIGLATAKGLAAAAGLPLYGVSSLDVVAASCTADRLICVVQDARKKEVYTAFYRIGPTGLPERSGDMAVLSPTALLDHLNEPVLLIGDALPQYGEFWQAALGDRCRFAANHLLNPQAAALGLIAGEQRQRGELLDIATTVPYYVRASDAELSLSKPG